MRVLLPLLMLTACDPEGLFAAPSEDSESPQAKPPEDKANLGRLPEPDATRAQVCADDCLLLTRYDVHTIKHRFDQLCCGEDGVPGDPRCGQPWPFPETASCDGWERLEKCVYARYGYEFKPGSKWTEEFSKEPWYKPTEFFQAGDMSIAAKRNTLALKQFASSKADCTPSRRRRRR